MARGLTLEQLIYNLRSEVGQSTNAAVSRSTRARFVTILNRVQRRLYADYDWPFLEIHRDIAMQAGERYYDFPVDIDIDRTVRFEFKWGGTWQKVGYGITDSHLNQYDSDQDVRSDPVWRWGFYLEPGQSVPQIETWPVPSTNGVPSTLDGYLRVHGIQKLEQMVEDIDTCLIDGDLCVLYSAAEILSKMRAADASAKLESANALYTKLKGRAAPSEPFKIGGDTFDMDGSCGRREIELRVAYAGQVP